jgi:hypothetical protein
MPPLLARPVPYNIYNSNSESDAEDSNWYNPRRRTHSDPNSEPPAALSSRHIVAVVDASGSEDDEDPQVHWLSISRPSQHNWNSTETTQTLRGTPTASNEASQSNETSTLFSVFNPSHSSITPKEKCNIRSNKTDNDSKGDIL